jgi:hypothetical protein
MYYFVHQRRDFWSAIMPIRAFLAGQAFQPEIIREMSLALESVRAKLELNVTDDAATRLVARKIIELAQRGVRDATTLSAMTLREFKHTNNNGPSGNGDH